MGTVSNRATLFAAKAAAAMRDLIGIMLVVAFIGAMIALLWKSVPKENEQLLSYMLGQLSGFVAGVVGYHYISKSGEKELETQRAINTGEAFRAVSRAAAATPPDKGAAEAADQVAEAAKNEADEIGKNG
jgi:hypothetical protein